MEQFIAQIIGGAAGGYGGGKAVKGGDMGQIGNLLAGGVGGLLGGGALGNLVQLDGVAALAGDFVGGGVAGLVVQVVVGMIVKRMRG